MKYVLLILFVGTNLYADFLQTNVNNGSCHSLALANRLCQKSGQQYGVKSCTTISNFPSVDYQARCTDEPATTQLCFNRPDVYLSFNSNGTTQYDNNVDAAKLCQISDRDWNIYKDCYAGHKVRLKYGGNDVIDIDSYREKVCTKNFTVDDYRECRFSPLAHLALPFIPLGSNLVAYDPLTVTIHPGGDYKTASSLGLPDGTHASGTLNARKAYSPRSQRCAILAEVVDKMENHIKAGQAIQTSYSAGVVSPISLAVDQVVPEYPWDQFSGHSPDIKSVGRKHDGYNNGREVTKESGSLVYGIVTENLEGGLHKSGSRFFGFSAAKAFASINGVESEVEVFKHRNQVDSTDKFFSVIKLTPQQSREAALNGVSFRVVNEYSGRSSGQSIIKTDASHGEFPTSSVRPTFAYIGDRNGFYARVKYEHMGDSLSAMINRDGCVEGSKAFIEVLNSNGNLLASESVECRSTRNYTMQETTNFWNQQVSLPISCLSTGNYRVNIRYNSQEVSSAFNYYRQNPEGSCPIADDGRTPAAIECKYPVYTLNDNNQIVTNYESVGAGEQFVIRADVQNNPIEATCASTGENYSYASFVEVTFRCESGGDGSVLGNSYDNFTVAGATRVSVTDSVERIMFGSCEEACLPKTFPTNQENPASGESCQQQTTQSQPPRSLPQDDTENEDDGEGNNDGGNQNIADAACTYHDYQVLDPQQKVVETLGVNEEVTRRIWVNGSYESRPCASTGQNYAVASSVEQTIICGRPDDDGAVGSGLSEVSREAPVVRIVNGSCDEAGLPTP